MIGGKAKIQGSEKLPPYFPCLRMDQKLFPLQHAGVPDENEVADAEGKQKKRKKKAKKGEGLLGDKPVAGAKKGNVPKKMAGVATPRKKALVAKGGGVKKVKPKGK